MTMTKAKLQELLTDMEVDFDESMSKEELGALYAEALEKQEAPVDSAVHEESIGVTASTTDEVNTSEEAEEVVPEAAPETVGSGRYIVVSSVIHDGTELKPGDVWPFSAGVEEYLLSQGVLKAE